MAVDWNVIREMERAGFRANPDGTITKPDGVVVRSDGNGGFTPVAPPGVDWGAIQALERDGYRANPDGTITSPDGAILAGSTGGDPRSVLKKSPADEENERIQREARAAQARAAQSTRSAVRNLLRQAGLEELDRFVDRWVQDGLSDAEIEAQLYDWDSEPGKIVDRLYPELRQRAEAGKRFMPIGQIREHMQAVQRIGRTLGIPEEFYSRDAITKQIVGDVSVDEFKDRADEYAALGLQELDIDPVLRSELESFERFYQVKLKPGEIAGMIFNADLALPTLKKRINSVRIDMAAGRARYGDVTRSEAERLAALGVDDATATQGFGQLVESQQLFNPLDAGEDTIDRSDQLGAVFEGDARARRRIEERARRRVAAFEARGTFASTQEGFAGIGTAS